MHVGQTTDDMDKRIIVSYTLVVISAVMSRAKFCILCYSVT